MRAAESLLVPLVCYLAGLLTARAAHWLRRRSWDLVHWRCRCLHGRHHFSYSEQSPGARYCNKCGACCDVGDLDWNPYSGRARRDLPRVGD